MYVIILGNPQLAKLICKSTIRQMLEKSDNVSEIKRDLRGIKEISQKMILEADEFSTLITKPNVNPDANMVVFVRNTHATLLNAENMLAKQIARLRTIK